MSLSSARRSLSAIRWAAPPVNVATDASLAMPRYASFDHGLRVSVAGNGLALVSIYSVIAYQRDTRARLPFLLGVFSPSTWAVLFLITAGIGLLGLAVTQGWSRRSVMGAGT